MNNRNYLLLGPEHGEKQKYIQNIKSKLKDTYAEKPEEYMFYSFDLNLADILALLRTPSLFSPMKIVTINGLESIKTKGEIDLILGYLKAPAEDCCLFLLSEQVQIDKRFEKQIPREQVKIFWELFDNQKLGWVQSFFRQQGMSIEGEAAELLLDMVTNNTMDLRRECERLVLFSGEQKIIREEDIAGFLYHSKEENVFSLFNKMAEKDLAGSLEILEKIIQSADASGIQIVAGLYWQYKKLLSYKLLLANQYKSEEALEQLAIRTKKSKRIYEKAAGNYNPAELENIIILTASCDTCLRNGKADLHRILLSLYIYGCVKGRGDSILPLFQ
ncbi:MAG: DNA polymerase III subunit delta [Spirochaetales bacterium]|nr:MAG: DNA polymerase III subunit delta [Spirochaetales bacterium]